MNHKTSRPLVFAFLVVNGCAPAVEDASSTASALAVDAESARVFALVAPEHRAELETMVGRFARGDAPIYRGSYKAHDNRSALGGRNVDGEMDTTAASASIVPVGDTYVLTVSAPNRAQRQYVVQDNATPRVTGLSIVLKQTELAGVAATCNDCAPVLADHPDAIDIPFVEALGTRAALRISAEGSLTRIPAADLTFEDIVRATDLYTWQHPRRHPSQFVAIGSEMVRTVSSTHRELTPVPVGKYFAQCHLVTSYDVSMYVDASTPRCNGLRDFAITGSQICCAETVPASVETCFAP